jgi:hypothetical protein
MMVSDIYLFNVNKNWKDKEREGGKKCAAKRLILNCFKLN